MEKTKSVTLSEILKGTLFAVVVSLALVLLFALFAKLFAIDPKAYAAVNFAIKILSVVIGVFLAVREEKGLLKGALIGVLFAVVSALIFTLLGGSFKIGSVLIDVLVCAVVGILAGVIRVNRKR